LNCCSLDSSGYVAVHLRFVNALENFEKDQFNSLTEDKRENLKIHSYKENKENASATIKNYIFKSRLWHANEIKLKSLYSNI
jgi:hypothetical protein